MTHKLLTLLSIRSTLICFLGVLIALGTPLPADAGPLCQAGAYHIEVTADPPTLPATGRARLLFKVTDAAGKPVEGATISALTKMPAMNMGEREETAIPVPGQPGTYTAPAQFAMEGEYESSIKISGPDGAAATRIAIHTGENTASSAGHSPDGDNPTAPSRWPWAFVLPAIGYTLFRMRRTGQRPSTRGFMNRSVIGGLLLLGLILWGAVYAVDHFRRPGAWTPIDAQSMEMNLPAPVGIAPVEVALVKSGGIQSTVRYAGQAVGYVEQDVVPRVQGLITWMPFYVGDRVTRGQILARLDTSQSGPLAAAQQGQLAMAEQGVGVAQKDYLQAQAMVTEADAEVGMKTGAVDAARADLTAAEQERVNAKAELDAAQSQIPDADAQLLEVQADQQYWRSEMMRESSLLKAGAVTQEEYQRESAQAQTADGKVRQAQARIVQVQAEVRAAQSNVSKADAGVTSATAKQSQTQSELEAHHAHVHSAQAAADSARQKIVQARTGVQQARATLAGALAAKDYSELRSETDGVITQRLISPGVLVSPGQAILRVAQISPIRLQANVTEADLSKIRVGARVLVSVENGGGRQLSARVTSISPSIDPTARTGVVEAVIPNTDRRFLPGQFVAMDLDTGAGGAALYIPTRALRYHTAPSGDVLSTESTPTVWIAEPVSGQVHQYTVHEAAVKTGATNDRDTEILGGLEAGWTVVTAGQDYLKDGDTVTATTPEPERTNPIMPTGAGVSAAAPPDNSRISSSSISSPSAGSTRAPKTLYTCPMHPEVVQNHPGKCPKCGMTLVPKKPEGMR